MRTLVEMRGRWREGWREGEGEREGEGGRERESTIPVVIVYVVISDLY